MERRYVMMGNSNEYAVIPNLIPVVPVAEPEIADGVSLEDLAVGAVVEVDTGHHTYRLENRGEGKVLISGHPKYCPEPVLVDFHGSLGGAPLFKMWFIGRSAKMEFRHPVFGVVLTSRIQNIREFQAETKVS